ncbi:hypothetical protein N39L_02070 [Limnospira platensis NIES-39]|uniref:Uncharacterized protein n=1 Tax=Limnospira platensis NIES-46 TaxID=1236695 RepID=A0A5M3T928_LIMPL|nr:hypothetical protein N39L_02070 [Arthrospira platensis NIES-39]GCE94925.1 hypothetical protein NIES46_29850 [Arthrospira platensis NIES-46]
MGDTAGVFRMSDYRHFWLILRRIYRNYSVDCLPPPCLQKILIVIQLD